MCVLYCRAYGYIVDECHCFQHSKLKTQLTFNCVSMNNLLKVVFKAVTSVRRCVESVALAGIVDRNLYGARTMGQQTGTEQGSCWTFK